MQAQTPRKGPTKLLLPFQLSNDSEMVLHSLCQSAKQPNAIVNNILLWHFMYQQRSTVLIVTRFFKNPSMYNIIRWVAWTMGQTNRRQSIWCSKYYFFSWFFAEFFAKILSIYLFIFLKKYKNKSKEFWVP